MSTKTPEDLKLECYYDITYRLGESKSEGDGAFDYIKDSQEFTAEQALNSGYGNPYKHYPKYSTLAKLYKEKVLGVAVENGKALFYEACDHHYSTELTAAELRVLIAELIEVLEILQAPLKAFDLP